MKFFRKKFDQLGEKYKDNKFMHTVIDGLDTFMFTPDDVTKGKGVHIRDSIDLKRTMVTVVIALQFCLLFGMFNIGHQHFNAFGLFTEIGDGIFQKFFYGALQMLPIIIVAHLVGLGIEFLFAAKKGHSIEEGFLVSGMLIPLIMPPDIPLWILAIAVAFAVIIGKEAFGGTGMNILNIALLARVFVFFAYPTEISGDICWVSYDYNILHDLFGMGKATMASLGLENGLPEGIANLKDYVMSNKPDGWTGATPLGIAKEGGWAGVLGAYSISEIFWGTIPGSIGEVSKPAILIGVAILLFSGIASWRIMVSMVIGAIVMGLVLNALAVNPLMEVPFHYHLLLGGFLFAMAFMATDPVTAAQTESGKWVYGFLIGVVGMIVRVLNPAYPEGWMLAILFMNVFAPLIDHIIIQRNIKKRLSRVSR